MKRVIVAPREAGERDRLWDFGLAPDEVWRIVPTGENICFRENGATRGIGSVVPMPIAKGDELVYIGRLQHGGVMVR